MLDLTAIFLLAGLLLAALHRGQNGGGTTASAGARAQAGLGAVVAVAGVGYSYLLVATNPAYSEALSFTSIRSLLINVLPSAAMGLVAGFVLRIGIGQMSVQLLAISAVFFILPFLMLQGMGLLRNFNTIQLGWFKADINSTDAPKPVEFQIQDLLDRSQAGVNPIDRQKYKTIEFYSKLDKKMEDIYKKIVNTGKTKPVPRDNKVQEVGVALFQEKDLSDIKGSAFAQNYLHPLIDCIQAFPEGFLRFENRIREAAEPFLMASETLLIKDAGKEAANKLGKELSERLGELKTVLADANNLRARSSRTPEEHVERSTNRTPCVAPGAANGLVEDRELRDEALPYILVSRLYRRIGNDKRALAILEDEHLRFTLVKDSPLQNHQQARFLLERGELRRALKQKGWEKDWLNVVSFWQGRIVFFNRYGDKCGENCDDVRKTMTHLRLDTAQLRNNYVFSLIQDRERRRAHEPDFLDDLVAEAAHNYRDLNQLSKIDEEISKNGGDPIYCPQRGSCPKLCVNVFYADTYALALMAQAQQESTKDLGDHKTKILDLLNKAMTDLRDTCSEKKDDLKPIIREHLKIAQELFAEFLRTPAGSARSRPS